MRGGASGRLLWLLLVCVSGMGWGSAAKLLLYLHPYSFYAQRVVMILAEKKLEYDSVVVDITGGENYEPWFLAVNPRGEVPVLKDGDKLVPDSTAIALYLEQHYSEEVRLLPGAEGSEERTKVRHWMELINEVPANVVTAGTCFHPELAQSPRVPFIGPVRDAMKASYGETAANLRRVAAAHPQYAPVLLPKAESAERNYQLVSNKTAFLGLLDQVDQLLGQVETQLATQEESGLEWLGSATFSLADVNLGILLERLSQVGLERRLWGDGRRPHLTAFYDRLRARDSYSKAIPGYFFFIQQIVGLKIIVASLVGIGATAAGLAALSWRRSR